MAAGPTVQPTPLEALDPHYQGGRDARAAYVSSVELEPGEWSPQSLPLEDRPVFGLLIVEGVITRDLLLADTVSSELLGPGDLLPYAAGQDRLLQLGLRWTVTTRARIALLDEAAALALARQPAVTARLVRRAARQSGRAAAHRAIAQLPRIEERLVALFWHLAERWGRVGAAGVIVPLALTHETLGRLVGAKRPTVSLALKALAAEGALQRRGDGAWVISHESAARLESTRGGWPGTDVSVLVTEDLHSSREAEDGVMRARESDASSAAALHARVAHLSADFALRRQETDAALQRCRMTRDRAMETRALLRDERRRAA